ncbi:MAG TPA: glycoside hydrolase family 65 protein, partial [Saprospiraceae bacterium]|nr:glycoside hydrolase family 65 protein [Saprospiraceae bacterium]
MKKYIEIHPWKIIETDFSLNDNMVTESLLAIGNGRMGQRAVFEETFTGETLRGSYLAGIYYPDKTRVGWWKNGYPEYFAKVLNAVDWLGLNIQLDSTIIDLGKLQPLDYRSELDMEKGLLSRTFGLQLPNDVYVRIHSERFYSKTHPDSALLHYRIKVEKGEVDFTLDSGLEADVRNQDTNYGEAFWENFKSEITGNSGIVTAQTKKTGFRIAASTAHKVMVNGWAINGGLDTPSRSSINANFSTFLSQDDEVIIEKYVSITTSFFYPHDDLTIKSLENLDEITQLGYDELRDKQVEAWRKSWDQNDIVIEGDDEAQQGIRFNIFQLNQTYTGEHALLNIGPKGFTGEKYGGATYWDTEAFAVPLFLSVADPEVTKTLLQYRHNQLPGAYHN